MAGKKRSTVVLVAQRAGVSIASVSRVLNGLPTSDDVRTRVEAAAADLRYVPDAVARSLKVGQTHQIVLAVADVGNPVYVAMMHAVSGVLDAAGFRLVLASTGNDPQRHIELVRSVNGGYADGLILVPLRITDELIAEVSSTRVPIVVGGTLPEHVGVDHVRALSADGVGLAADHLHERGRRRIAFVNGPVDTGPGLARRTGYLTAMGRLGLTITSESQVVADDFTFAAGLVAAEELLGQSSPDAVICANDLLAVATMKVLAARGRHVPDDVAVVGMDNSELADLATPTLTSVDLGSARRGVLAARLMLDRLDDPDLPAQRITVEPTLVVRESTES